MVAIVPIPNYPRVTNLTGNELTIGVQSGTTVAITTGQIANLKSSFAPATGPFAVTTITAAYAVQLTDFVILATNAAGVPTFPTAVGNSGIPYIFKNNSGSSITPATTGGQTIDGGAPSAIANHGVLRIFSDGANWQTW